MLDGTFVNELPTAQLLVGGLGRRHELPGAGSLTPHF